jgi:hypothetical protein
MANSLMRLRIKQLKNGTGITRLSLGELPLKMRQQLVAARKYRVALEQLTVEAKGQVNATDAHLIDEAAGAEIHASVCRWLLRTKIDTMSVSDIAKCSAEVMRARGARNRAVERLGLNVPVALPWQVVEPAEPKEQAQ